MIKEHVYGVYDLIENKFVIKHNGGHYYTRSGAQFVKNLLNERHRKRTDAEDNRYVVVIAEVEWNVYP